MTKWPAHLEERARIFELTGADGEPLKGPTRALLEWDDDAAEEIDPATLGPCVLVASALAKTINNGVSQ